MVVKQIFFSVTVTFSSGLDKQSLMLKLIIIIMIITIIINIIF